MKKYTIEELAAMPELSLSGNVRHVQRFIRGGELIAEPPSARTLDESDYADRGRWADVRVSEVALGVYLATRPYHKRPERLVALLESLA